MLFELLITSVFIGFSAFAVVQVMQPRDALVVHGSVETSLWDKLLSLWTMVNPVVEVPMIDLGAKLSYELSIIDQNTQSTYNNVALVFVSMCILVCILVFSVYSILQSVPAKQKIYMKMHTKGGLRYE